MAFFTTDDGIRMYYEEHGQGEQTLLFVHGYTGSCEGFYDTLRHLPKKYRVILYDLRAHGKSGVSPAGYTMTRYAQDLKGLLDHLKPERVTAVGYSMGVHILYRFIQLYGQDYFEKLVVSVMSPRLLTDDDYHLGLNGKCTARDALDAIIRINRSFYDYSLRNMTDDMSEEMKQAVRDHAAELVATLQPGPMTGLLIAMFEHDFWPVLDTITLPALVIAGEGDIYPRATQEEQHRRLKNSKLVIVPGAGHLLFTERPDVYAAELAEFMG